MRSHLIVILSRHLLEIWQVFETWSREFHFKCLNVKSGWHNFKLRYGQLIPLIKFKFRDYEIKEPKAWISRTTVNFIELSHLVCIRNISWNRLGSILSLYIWFFVCRSLVWQDLTFEIIKINKYQIPKPHDPKTQKPQKPPNQESKQFRLRFNIWIDIGSAFDDIGLA